MSVDMLTMTGGTGKTGSVLSLNGSGQGKADPGGGALGDFAAMMKAQAGVSAPAGSPQGQDALVHGKLAKKAGAAIKRDMTGKTETGTAESSTAAAVSVNGTGWSGVKGESKESAEASSGTRRRKSTDEKRVMEEGDDGARAGAVNPALALVLPSAEVGGAGANAALPTAGKIDKVDMPGGEGARGRGEVRAVSAGPAAQALVSGDIANAAAIAEAIPVVSSIGDGSDAALVSTSEPGAGEGPDGEAPVVHGSRPARPGEATALLNMVKSDLPAKAEGVARNSDRQAEPVPPGRSGEDVASAATPAAPTRGRDPIPPGLAVAAEQASDRAQPVIARVVERLSDQADGVPVRPKQDQAAMQVSPLAIATAQSAVTSQKDEAAAMGKDGGPVSQDTGDDGTLLMTGAPEGRGTARADMGSAAIAPSADSLSLTGSVASGAVPNGLAVGSSLSSSGVGATLGQQVIDMGVSGQWIDDIAREIAGMASNPGHGSFRIASPTLGTVQVEIAPGADGADVRMTVDNEAAQAALSKDQARLVQDAQMAAVRIGDVRIDRIAPAADAQRGDMGQNGGQNGQNQGGQQAQAAFGQSGGQGNQSGTRQDMTGFGSGGPGGNSGDNSPKSSFTRTVIRDVAAMDSAAAVQDKADSARYA